MAKVSLILSLLTAGIVATSIAFQGESQLTGSSSRWTHIEVSLFTHRGQMYRYYPDCQEVLGKRGRPGCMVPVYTYEHPIGE